MAELVASIYASSTEEMIRAMRESTTGADGIELRADALLDPDLGRLRAENAKPLILTCRSRPEGGDFRGSENERLEILRRGLELGFDYVDIELASLTPDLRRMPTPSKIIASYHCFDEFPDDLSDRVERAVELGADAVKLAVRASSVADAFRLADIGSRARERGVGFIPVALGPAGTAARILACRFQADFVYASLPGFASTGPGQLDLEELTTLYRFHSIGPDTRIYGILGESVAGSLSPAMHNSHFHRIGWDAVYVPFEEENLGVFIDAARRLGIDGLSVTRPYKESVRGFLDEVDAEAERIGAVNTICIRDGRWTGYNTDVEGVVGPVSRRIALEGARTVVAGAGGAARAAAFGLARKGAQILILARRREAAERLAAEIGAEAGTLEDIDRWDWDVLIQATPVGSGELTGRLPVSIRGVRPGAVVLEMVYDPEWTRLAEAARRLGAEVITGVEMLVTQAVRQAEIWTGTRPPYPALERVARAELERRSGQRVATR